MAKPTTDRDRDSKERYTVPKKYLNLRIISEPFTVGACRCNGICLVSGPDVLYVYQSQLFTVVSAPALHDMPRSVCKDSFYFGDSVDQRGQMDGEGEGRSYQE